MLKKALLEQCRSFVNDKLSLIESIMTANRRALEHESKSSAGDKHETGRAMLHLEMEKASQQFQAAKQMKEVLDRIELNSASKKIRLGSLVATDQGVYFLSISAGELIVDGKYYYAVSPSSPIGNLLVGKESGSNLTLGSKVINIMAVE